MIVTTNNSITDSGEDTSVTRIRLLNDKWSGIQCEIDREKEYRNDAMSDQITSLERTI